MADEEAPPAENEDLAALGGRELLSAKMELSTAKHDLSAKLRENVVASTNRDSQARARGQAMPRTSTTCTSSTTMMWKSTH